MREVLGRRGVDGDEVFAAIAEGWPRQAFRKAHEAAVADHRVFGVPTFIAGDAVGLRADHDAARRRRRRWPGRPSSTSSSCSADHPELNEFKHTSISR